MSGKHWLVLDIKNTFYVWSSFKKKKEKKKVPCNFPLGPHVAWYFYTRLLLPYLSSYLQVNPNVCSQESGMHPNLSMWFYVQGENTRLTQRYSITTQLLVLYYVLSYEEALLANTKILGIRERVGGNQINWTLDAKRGILIITKIHVAVRFEIVWISCKEI